MVKKKAKSILENFMRDIVFGMEDGLVSNLGIIFALWVAGSSRNTILLAGLASLFAGSLSMSVGSYLSSKSQREVYENEIKKTKELIQKRPKFACKELAKTLKSEGFDQDEINIMSKHFLEHNEETFFQNFVQKKLKLSPERFDNPIKNAFIMFLSFSIGSIFPIIPFFFSNNFNAILISSLLTISTLFLVGVTKSVVSHRNWIKSGFEMVVLGLGAGIIGYLVGVGFNLLI